MGTTRVVRIRRGCCSLVVIVAPHVGRRETRVSMVARTVVGVGSFNRGRIREGDMGVVSGRCSREIVGESCRFRGEDVED